jgi:lysozyme
MIEGIDVSTYQGEMDWTKPVPAGAQFAIIRAGSINDVTGICYEDHQHDRNWTEASKVLPRKIATYWYFRPNHSAVKQAEYYIDLIKDHEPMVVMFQGGVLVFRAACDIEVAGRADVVKAFCDLLLRAFPGEAVPIYTSVGKLALLTGIKTWMRNHPLWMADWTYPYPVPLPWTDHFMHQYAVLRDGEKYGVKSVSKALDHDRGNFYFPTPPPPPPDHRHPDLEARLTALEQA